MPASRSFETARDALNDELTSGACGAARNVQKRTGMTLVVAKEQSYPDLPFYLEDSLHFAQSYWKTRRGEEKA